MVLYLSLNYVYLKDNSSHQSRLLVFLLFLHNTKEVDPRLTQKYVVDLEDIISYCLRALIFVLKKDENPSVILK